MSIYVFILFYGMGCSTLMSGCLTIAVCNELLDYESTVTVEVGMVEMACVYYLAGYVLSHIKKHDVT